MSKRPRIAHALPPEPLAVYPLELHTIAEAVYGAGYTRLQLAEGLSAARGRKVSLSIVSMWSTGARPIPGWLTPVLDALLLEGAAEHERAAVTCRRYRADLLRHQLQGVRPPEPKAPNPAPPEAAVDQGQELVSETAG
ncbi:hypothetical protein FV226_07630 [Methylobacterium sp. WL12]|uniref:hypothetical protein n=1 Tax=Methylobacterium sp. WL12 TaxID=2603890 RepID=UPI0011CAEC3E|nr:hypothetical protein [Methylobacterium sp. WL12]TXM74138.1 hypothetical protein FV226_07630 [Methylobacterium sp. WL12]